MFAFVRGWAFRFVRILVIPVLLIVLYLIRGVLENWLFSFFSATDWLIAILQFIETYSISIIVLIVILLIIYTYVETRLGFLIINPRGIKPLLKVNLGDDGFTIIVKFSLVTFTPPVQIDNPELHIGAITLSSQEGAIKLDNKNNSYERTFKLRSDSRHYRILRSDEDCYLQFFALDKDRKSKPFKLGGYVANFGVPTARATAKGIDQPEHRASS